MFKKVTICSILFLIGSVAALKLNGNDHKRRLDILETPLTEMTEMTTVFEPVNELNADLENAPIGTTFLFNTGTGSLWRGEILDKSDVTTTIKSTMDENGAPYETNRFPYRIVEWLNWEPGEKENNDNQ